MKNRAFLAMALVAVGAVQAAASTVFAYDVRTGRFVSFDTATPLTQTVLGTNATAFSTVRSLDFNASGSTLYALENGATTPNSIKTVNMSNGSFNSTLAITGLTAGDGVSGMKLINDTTAYVSAINGVSSNLYSVNLGTGAATLIGNINATNAIIDIALDNSGNLYGTDITNDQLWRINTATGLGTQIGPLGIAISFSQGMDFDPNTGTLYATLYTGSGVGAFASINTTTGAATSLAATTSTNGEYEMAVAPVPEPATMTVLAVGAAALAARRRRRK